MIKKDLKQKGKAIKISEISEEELDIKSEVAKIERVYNSNNGETSSSGGNNVREDNFDNSSIINKEELSSNALIIQDLNNKLLQSKENLDKQLETFKQGKELVLTEFNKAVKSGISSATLEYQTSAVGIASAVVDLIPVLSNAYHLGNTIIDGIESVSNKVSDTKSNFELEKNHRIFLKVLDTEVKKYKLIITELKSSVDDKDLILKVKDDNLLLLNKEYDKALLRLDELRIDLEKVKKSQNKQIDWNEIIESQRNKIVDSSTLTIEQLNEEIAEKSELIKQMAIASRNLEIDLILLKDDNQALIDKVESLEEQKIKDIENIAIWENNKLLWENNKILWENNKKELLKDLQTQTDRFHRMNGETILLENEIDKLELDKFNLEKKLEQLNSDYENLNKELTKTSIHLTSTKEDLQDIQRLNFESKVKLQGVLFLDSMRTLMPSFFNHGLTAIETTIFISGITNHPNIEKAGWISITLFIVVSILYSSYKTIKFTWFKGIDLINWSKGKKKDLNN